MPVMSGVCCGGGGASGLGDYLKKEDAEDLYMPRFTGEPNGFVNRDDVALTFDDGTRTITIAPVGANYQFYSNGVLYEKTSSEQLQISDVEGDHFVYFDDDGVIQESVAFSDDIVVRYCFFAAIYWDATNKEAVPCALNETHGCEMPAEVHYYLHRAFGTRYNSGLSLTLIADGDGSLDAHCQFSSSSGAMSDEDIPHLVDNHVSTTADLNVLYRLGGSGDWRMTVGNTAPIIQGGAGRAQWNEYTGSTWQLTEPASGSFVLSHIYAVPGIDYKHGIVIAVVGQNVYATAALARAGAVEEAYNLQLGTLPFVEFVLVATLIVETKDVFTNTFNSRFVQTDTGDDYIDWRNVVPVPPSINSTSYPPGGISGQVQFNNAGTFAGSSVTNTELVNIAPTLNYQSLTAAIDPLVTDLNLSSYRAFFITFDAGDAILNFTSPPSTGDIYHAVVSVTQDGIGSRSISEWQVGGVTKVPAYPGGASPTLSGGSNERTDLHVFIFGDGSLTVKLAGSDVS